MFSVMVGPEELNIYSISRCTIFIGIPTRTRAILFIGSSFSFLLAGANPYDVLGYEAGGKMRIRFGRDDAIDASVIVHTVVCLLTPAGLGRLYSCSNPKRWFRRIQNACFDQRLA